MYFHNTAITRMVGKVRILKLQARIRAHQSLEFYFHVLAFISTEEDILRWY